jgi:hypothetical protein
MTRSQQVTFAWKHREHFAEVAAHNLEVTAERYRGNWDNGIRNAWEELAAERRTPPSDDRTEGQHAKVPS